MDILEDVGFFELLIFATVVFACPHLPTLNVDEPLLAAPIASGELDWFLSADAGTWSPTSRKRATHPLLACDKLPPSSSQRTVIVVIRVHIHPTARVILHHTRTGRCHPLASSDQHRWKLRHRSVS